jgi:AAA domain
MTIKFASHQRLSMLIHARSKTGKSTLSSTAPQPILVLDAEGSWRFIPARQMYWDPEVGPPPAYDGTWDVCIVSVTKWSTVEMVYRWLTGYDCPFITVVMDSITEIQRRCRANLKGIEAMRIQDWGVLLSLMDNVIRGYRDLQLLPTSRVRCVVFIAESRPDNASGRMVPYMQGQISISLPYWVDICGYMYSENEIDVNGQPTNEIRKVWVGQHQNYETGERVQGRLGNYQIIPRPPMNSVGTDITDWMRTVFRMNEPAAAETSTMTVAEIAQAMGGK